MSEPQSSWAFVGISPEARQAAETAAHAAGMELDTWLAQLIKYKSTMELKGREAVPLDDAIMQIAAPGSAATEPAEPETEPVPNAEPAPKAGAEPRVGADALAEVRAAIQAGAEPEAAAAAGIAREPETATEERQEPEATVEASPAAVVAPEPAAEQRAAEEPAAHEVAAGEVEEEDRETVVLPALPMRQSAAARTGPAAAAPTDVADDAGPAAMSRPLADNDTGPVEDEPEEAPAPSAPERAAAAPESGGEDAPSPRKILPTEALRPSRLSALNQSTEEAIQGAFDAWRDSRTVEPLLVRPSPDERNVFEVIVGIERWHAARRAHIRELPVRVHHASDEDAIRLAMSSRLKRGPLSPLTEAGIYLSLMSEASMATEQVARMVGKPPAHVATMVRVLNLPRAVREMMERGELTALHARALLDAPNAEALAREVIARRLDIYQTEQLVRTASLKAERAEKVDLDAVDLDLGGGDLSDGEYQGVAVDPSTLDGDIGFGPETRFDREDFDRERLAASAEAGNAALADEAGGDLVFDDVPDESLDLIDAPEIDAPEIEAPEVEAAASEASAVDAGAVAFARLYGGSLGKEAGAERPAPSPFGSPDGEATDGKPAGAKAAGGAGDKPAAKDRTAEKVEGKKGEGEKEAAEPASLPGPKKGVVTTELLEHHLSHLLGLKVSISEWHNMGVISIHYTNREELGDVVSRLNSGSPR